MPLDLWFLFTQLAMAWLVSGACLLIAWRCRRVIVSQESWILYNLAVLLPILVVSVTDRPSWLLPGLEMGAGFWLTRVMRRESRPGAQYEQRLLTALWAAYTSYFLAAPALSGYGRPNRLLAVPLVTAMVVFPIWYVARWGHFLALFVGVVLPSLRRKPIPLFPVEPPSS